METIIDRYKALRNVLILDGYKPEDYCIGRIDRLIDVEEKKAVELSEIKQITDPELLEIVHFIQDHIPALIRNNKSEFVNPFVNEDSLALCAYAIGVKIHERQKRQADMLKMAITSLKDIDKHLPRLTTGNLSHQMRTIQGIARRNVEYIEKHLNDEQ